MKKKDKNRYDKRVKEIKNSLYGEDGSMYKMRADLNSKHQENLRKFVNESCNNYTEEIIPQIELGDRVIPQPKIIYQILNQIRTYANSVLLLLRSTNYYIGIHQYNSVLLLDNGQFVLYSPLSMYGQVCTPSLYPYISKEGKLCGIDSGIKLKISEDDIKEFYGKKKVDDISLFDTMTMYNNTKSDHKILCVYRLSTYPVNLIRDDIVPIGTTYNIIKDKPMPLGMNMWSNITQSIHETETRSLPNKDNTGTTTDTGNKSDVKGIKMLDHNDWNDISNGLPEDGKHVEVIVKPSNGLPSGRAQLVYSSNVNGAWWVECGSFSGKDSYLQFAHSDRITDWRYVEQQIPTDVAKNYIDTDNARDAVIAPTLRYLNSWIDVKTFLPVEGKSVEVIIDPPAKLGGGRVHQLMYFHNNGGEWCLDSNILADDNIHMLFAYPDQIKKWRYR